MTDEFDEMLKEVKNRDTLTKEPATSQYSDGDPCDSEGCKNRLHERHFPRDPNSDFEPHESYNEYEYICSIHGIVKIA